MEHVLMCPSCEGFLSERPLSNCGDPALHEKHPCNRQLGLIITTTTGRQEMVLRCRFDGPHPGQNHWDGDYEWG